MPACESKFVSGSSRKATSQARVMFVTAFAAPTVNLRILVKA